MRVLITGGGGFVGSHVAEALFRRGDEVVVLDDFSTGHRDNLRHLENRRGFELVDGSAGDRRTVHSLIRNTDAVVHLAGRPASLDEHELGETGRQNLLAAGNVLREAGRAGRRTVLVVPEADAHADLSEEWGIDDDQAARRIRSELGVPVTIVRLRNVVGPRQSPAFASTLPRFVHRAMAGDDLVIDDSDRDGYAFVYVDDVVDGLVRVLDRRDAAGRAVELGSDEVTSLEDLARLTVERAASRSAVRTGAGTGERCLSPWDAVPGISNLDAARAVVGWEPRWRLTDVIDAMISEQRGDPIFGPPAGGAAAGEEGAGDGELVRSTGTQPDAPAGAEPSDVATRSGAVDEHGEEPISLIVPVYNEALSVVETVRRIRAQPIPMQLIVVDDGSTDGTTGELSKVGHLIDDLVVLPYNHGKGAALRAGLQLARHDVVVFQDADLELDPDEIPKLVEPVRQGVADFVNGNRLHRANRPFIPRVQLFGNLGLRWWARYLHGLPIRDMESAAKVLRRETLVAMKLRSERFEIEPEISAKATALDVTFLELPISFRPRTRAQGKKLRWRDGFIALWTLFRYRRWDAARDTTSPRPVLVVDGRTEEDGSSDGSEAQTEVDRSGGASGGGDSADAVDASARAVEVPDAALPSNDPPFEPPPFTPLQPAMSARWARSTAPAG